MKPPWFALLLSLPFAVAVQAQTPVPLVADITGSSVKIEGSHVKIGEGRKSVEKALIFDGQPSRAFFEGTPLLHRIGKEFTVTAWVNVAALTPGKINTIVSKRPVSWRGAPFILSLGGQGEVMTQGEDGLGWSANFNSPPGTVKPNQWTHIAFTWKPGAQGVQWVDGKSVAQKSAERGLAANNEPLEFGWDEYNGARFNGKIGTVRVYARALTEVEIAQEMAGTLATRPAADTDFAAPTQWGRLYLTRYDIPEPYRERRDGDFDSVLHQVAERRPGPDAVDWPAITLDGKPIFAAKSEDVYEFPLRQGDQMKPLFRQTYDHTVQPGDHWVRMLEWFWNRKQIYTTDFTAHGSATQYELMTFPVRISGPGLKSVADVSLSYAGKEIYRNPGPLRSLTLLLPAVAPAAPYTLTVGGKTMTFAVGLQPLQPGNPQEKRFAFRKQLTPSVTVETPTSPEPFPYQSAWDEDVKAMLAGTPPAALPSLKTDNSLAGRVGVEIPRSPLKTFGIDLQHGMSSGWIYDGTHVPAFAGSVEQYAKFLAQIGFDAVYEAPRGGELEDPANPRSFDNLLTALNRHGVQGGLVPPGIHNPNIGLYAATLPEFFNPTVRDVQISATRFSRYPNFIGINQGADNAGYVSYWDWAGPIMNRPWARAYSVLAGNRFDKAPVGPAIPVQKDYERKGTQREFLDFVRRYDATFGSYGAFDAALAEANPALNYITGSFGSSPGVGGHGGWAWASVPGKAMFNGVRTLTVYDWNETSSSKPLHNVALIDRLRSVYPNKPLWTIIDDFGLFFGREARQRAYALALTRGPQAIGTNFLAHPGAKPEAAEGYKELFGWAHRYGGMLAQRRPVATIGVLFVQEQAVSRPQVGDDRPYEGSHEGKTTEALILCHAAGYPARIVTTDELKRGPLPAEMKALLLVGLNRFDSTWVWSAGLEKSLQAFAGRGGRVVLDKESVCDVAGIKPVLTPMTVASYVNQRENDWMPEILERNRPNIPLLRDALKGTAPPICTSDDPTVWAIPTAGGDVQGVTVVNWGSEPGKNASVIVKPQTAALHWNTKRIIYDLTERRRITPAEAAICDLTRDGFRWYALTPAPVTIPKIAVTWDAKGRGEAFVTVSGPEPMRGVPVEIILQRGAEIATIYGATGTPIPLPLRTGDAATALNVTELLSGLTAKTTLTPPAPKPASRLLAPDPNLARFAARKAIPLIIALTAPQQNDAATQKIAASLASFYRNKGRTVTIRSLAPKGVVRGLQPIRSALRYPQWQTVNADLILLGTPQTNLLIFDEARGHLLPDGAAPPTNKRNAFILHSPFVGGQQVLNLLGADAAALNAAARVIAP